jgi:hypothetical protein
MSKEFINLPKNTEPKPKSGPLSKKIILDKKMRAEKEEISVPKNKEPKAKAKK